MNLISGNKYLSMNLIKYNKTNMKYILKAISNNNRDMKSSVILITEDYSFLFNCPDGFQRAALI